MPLRTLYLAIVLAIAGSQSVLAQGRIGTAVRVVNQVTADQSLIVTGDGVSQNQTVEVADGSLGELKLDDSTKLALGPGAKLVLDKFVYDPDKSTGDVSVNLVKGAFRFITGAAQKRDYKIKTPSAAISVRGTVFDIYIAPNGAEWLLLHEGSIEVCGTGKQCRVLDNPCNVLQLTPAGAVGRPGGWSSQSGGSSVEFDEAFPFVKNPPTVDPVVYHTRVQVEANQCPNPNAPLKNNYENFEQRADAPPPSSPPAPSAPYSPRSEPIDNVQTPSVAGPGGSIWTGIYVGASAGRGTGTQTSNIDCQDAQTGFFSSTSPNYPCSEDFVSPVVDSRLIYETRTSGFVGGGQAGLNFQAGNLVFGGEADISYSDIGGNAPRTIGGVFPFLGGAQISEDIRWFGTVRGRAGFAFGNVLVFGTAGLAMGDVKYNYALSNSNFPGAQASASKSATKVGWTAGGGIEFGFGLWSLKTEYLYFDLGSEELTADVTAAPFGGPSTDPGVTFTSDFETQGHIFRTGLSYHFN